jgi:broad specificity phosphatase PhoE
MNSNTITFFRHGQSAYLMGNNPCKIENAFDLCATPLYEEEKICDRIHRACEEVRQNIRSLAYSMNPKTHVTIFTSPMARTIHTAKIIQEELLKLGFIVSDLHLEELLSEVGNFSWELFEPLMTGGTVKYSGTLIELNKKETNPKDLVCPDYFILDLIHCIPDSVKQTWPKDYRQRIESFEKFSDVTKRSLKLIQQVVSAITNRHIIFVGHEASSMYIADKFTRGKQKGLFAGTSISLEKNGLGNLVVTRVGDFTDGDSTTQVFLDFFEQK